MKKTFLLSFIVPALALARGTPVSAAPNEEVSHVAACAVEMGGQHVAECAGKMGKGVSECAQMSGPCDHAS